jgi:hypothetical protein
MEALAQAGSASDLKPEPLVNLADEVGMNGARPSVGTHCCVNYLVRDDALAALAADVMGERLWGVLSSVPDEHAVGIFARKLFKTSR